MRKSTRPALLEKKPGLLGWESISGAYQGSFNFVYKSTRLGTIFPNAFAVLKINRDTAQKTDSSERSLRIWNTLYPEFPGQLRVVTITEMENHTPFFQTYGLTEATHVSSIYHEKLEGWVIPFFEGEKPTDDEMVEELLRIYLLTGRIVTDGCSYLNFVKINHGGVTKVICIDIGCALFNNLSDPDPLNASQTSRYFWKGYAGGYPEYWAQIETGINSHGNKIESNPRSVYIIQSLLLLDQYFHFKDELIIRVCKLSRNDSILPILLAKLYVNQMTISIKPEKLTAFIENYLNNFNFSMHVKLQFNKMSPFDIPQLSAEKIKEILIAIELIEPNSLSAASPIAELLKNCGLFGPESSPSRSTDAITGEGKITFDPTPVKDPSSGSDSDDFGSENGGFGTRAMSAAC